MSSTEQILAELLKELIPRVVTEEWPGATVVFSGPLVGCPSIFLPLFRTRRDRRPDGCSTRQYVAVVICPPGDDGTATMGKRYQWGRLVPRAWSARKALSGQLADEVARWLRPLRHLARKAFNEDPGAVYALSPFVPAEEANG